MFFRLFFPTPALCLQYVLCRYIYVHINLIYIIKRKTTSAQLRAITLTAHRFGVLYHTELWYMLRLLRYISTLFIVLAHTMLCGFCIGLCLDCFWRETRGDEDETKETERGSVASDRLRETESTNTTGFSLANIYRSELMWIFSSQIFSHRKGKKNRQCYVYSRAQNLAIAVDRWIVVRSSKFDSVLLAARENYLKFLTKLII